MANQRPFRRPSVDLLGATDSGLARAESRPSARKRYRFRRRHTPHYYLVITALSGAALVCVLKTAAYLTKSVILASISFGAVVFTALAVSVAFFWGFYMVMNGNIPVRRLRVLAPHAMLGVLSPLFYTLNISVALDSVGTQPESGLSLVTSFFCLGLLGIQFRMGRAVVRPEPIRLLRRSDRKG